MIQSSEISGVDSLSQAISQVSIKALEITCLRKQNENLADMDENMERARKALKYRCRELMEKNNKIAKQVFGQATLQGTKHLI